MQVKLDRKSTIRRKKVTQNGDSMEQRRSTESKPSKKVDESTYSHFFEMNKTKNEESMLETTRNDISMNTDII